MSVDLIFDYLGMRLNSPKATGKKFKINFNFSDTGETALLFLAIAALNHSPDRQDPNADAALTLTRAV